MFGLSWSEILIIAVVALICVGPSDLPRALKTAAKWMSAGRKLAREFQGHVDELVREAELDELRDKARALTSQSLSSHMETLIDPHRELADALSPPEALTSVPEAAPSAQAELALDPTIAPPSTAPAAPAAEPVPMETGAVTRSG